MAESEILEKLAEFSSTADKIVYLTNLGFDNEYIASLIGSTPASVSSIKSKNRHLITFTKTKAIAGVIPVGKECVLNIARIDDMEFPEFNKYKTNTVIDKLWSDHDSDGGVYTGTVTICTGESGSGKSTLLIDLLYQLYINNPSSLPLYISSEMTRGDIFFYRKKMPGIGLIDTLIMDDHIKDGTIVEAIKKALTETDHKIIVLDSYQDMVEKIKENTGWKSTDAENYITHLMVHAADKQGKAIIAIQHQTKGGEYVGRSYLKHATTAMLEVRFDDNKLRYAMFSKNRRGGSMTHIPLYFYLKEDGHIIYDDNKFNLIIDATKSVKSEEERQKLLEDKFNSIFNLTKSATDEIHKEDEITEEFIESIERIEDNS